MKTTYANAYDSNPGRLNIIVRRNRKVKKNQKNYVTGFLCASIVVVVTAVNMILV